MDALTAQIELAPIHWLFVGIAAVAAVALVIWIISAGVAKGVRSANGGNVARTPPSPHGAFPVAVDAVDDGPGTFRVTGVDRTTKADVTDDISAASPANAKVKAELRGIVVTSIERV